MNMFHMSHPIRFGNHIETKPQQLLSSVVKPLVLRLVLARQLSTLAQVKRLWLPRRSPAAGSYTRVKRIQKAR